MTRTSTRLAELDRISRERSLTDAEQAEVLRLAKRQREYEAKNRRRRSDPVFRAKCIAGERRAKGLPPLETGSFYRPRSSV